jgi:hypothetical protein
MNDRMFGSDFETYPASAFPSKAIQWDSLEHASRCYGEFCADCMKYGMIPMDYFVYIGEKEGDEETYGYPDYPDIILHYNRDTEEVEVNNNP